MGRGFLFQLTKRTEFGLRRVWRNCSLGCWG